MRLYASTGLGAVMGALRPEGTPVLIKYQLIAYDTREHPEHICFGISDNHGRGITFRVPRERVCGGAGLSVGHHPAMLGFIGLLRRIRLTPEGRAQLSALGETFGPILDTVIEGSNRMAIEHWGHAYGAYPLWPWSSGRHYRNMGTAYAPRREA